MKEACRILGCIVLVFLGLTLFMFLLIAAPVLLLSWASSSSNLFYFLISTAATIAWVLTWIGCGSYVYLR
jgi:hypothetical protein